MAASVCVIAANVGGLKDYIQDNQNGLLFESEDYEALGELILNLINNPFLRNEIAKNGYEASQKYSWTNISDEILSLYREVLNTI